MSLKSASCDHTLNKLVDDVLKQSPYFARRPVRFETEQGRVILRGVVNSYYEKQMVQEILRRVDGIGQIDNHLEVDWQ